MDNDRAMSEFISEAKAILSEIKSHQSVHAQQLANYKEIIDSSISFNKERLDLQEKRQAGFRNLLIALMGLILVSFISDKIALNDRPTQKEISDEFLSIERAYRGFGSVIEDTYNTFETTEDLDHVESDALKIKAKQNVLKEVQPDYVTRGIKIK